MRIRTSVIALGLMSVASFSTGCTKEYKCTEQKDTSQTAKWKELGIEVDSPEIQICEASDLNFSAVYPTPPGAERAVKNLDIRLQGLGFQPTPSKTYVRKDEEKTISRRYNVCDPPQNPLGTVYKFCSKQLDIQVDVLPDNYKGKPYLLWAEYRDGLHDRYDLSP